MRIQLEYREHIKANRLYPEFHLDTSLICNKEKKIIMEYWIARDLDNRLYLYTNEPVRKTEAFVLSKGLMYQIDEHLFPEVTWENSPKQVNIELL